MELKHVQKNNSNSSQSVLLIVPYGIETCYLRTGVCLALGLLIVPYGIETYNKEAATYSQQLLLIVPYGIETSIFVI